VGFQARYDQLAAQNTTLQQQVSELIAAVRGGQSVGTAKGEKEKPKGAGEEELDGLLESAEDEFRGMDELDPQMTPLVRQAMRKIFGSLQRRMDARLQPVMARVTQPDRDAQDLAHAAEALPQWGVEANEDNMQSALAYLRAWQQKALEGGADPARVYGEPLNRASAWTYAISRVLIDNNKRAVATPVPPQPEKRPPAPLRQPGATTPATGRAGGGGRGPIRLHDPNLCAFQPRR
jgi:hypothetical protein